MTSIHTAPELDFFWSSDILPAEGHTTIWSESSDYIQPPAVHDPLRDQHLGDLDAHTAALFGNLPNCGTTFETVDTANTAEIPSAPTSNIYLEDLINDFDDVYQDSCSPWSTATPPLTDSSPLSSPFGDAPWAEDIPSPSYVTAGTYCQDQIPSGSAAPTSFQPELAWPFEPGQIDNTAIPYFAGDASLEGQIAPDYSAIFFSYTGLDGTTSYPAEWAHPEFYGPTLGAATTAAPAPVTSSTAHMQAMPGTVLGKRPRGAEEACDDGGLGADDDHQQRPRKRGKGKRAMNGVLEAAGPTSRVRHKPATRTPTEINGKSKTVGCGAERLAAPNAQEEIYHQCLPGPSVQQVLVGTPVWEQPTWVEGSVEGGTWQHSSSMVQPEVEVQDVHSTENDEHDEQAEDEPFSIPRRVQERHQALLAATPDDWRRGTVTVIKCRLCPGADFSDWEDFKRHCDTAEAHPWKISFCDRCGDFFARNDSLERHRGTSHKELIPGMVEIKRQKTIQAHEEFKARLSRCMKTGEELGMPFSSIIKAMFPKSSKKGSKEQSRLSLARKSKSRKTGH